MTTSTENNPFPPSTPSTSGSHSSATPATLDAPLGSNTVAKIDNALNGDAVNRVARSAHEAVDRVAERALPAVERLRTGLHDARDAVRARADDLTVMQEEWADQCRSTVREKPLTSLAVAAVAGMILSRLLAR